MAKNKKVSLKKKETGITTIKLENKTKDRLEHLKEHKESYNEIINKALNILNICLKNPRLANKILRDIERSRKMSNLIENPEKILRRRGNNYLPENDELDNIDSDTNVNINKRAEARIQLRPETINHTQRSLNMQRQQPVNKNLQQRVPPKFSEVRE